MPLIPTGTPIEWIKNEELIAIGGGGTLTTWPNSGSAGDWTSTGNTITTIGGVQLTDHATYIGGADTPPSSSITLFWANRMHSGNTENNMVVLPSAFEIEQDSTNDVIRIILYNSGGLENFTGIAPEGTIGNFSQPRIISVRFTEGVGAGGSLEVWVDGSAVTLTDGVQADSTVMTTAEDTLPAPTGPWELNEQFIAAHTAELLIYNTALTDEQVEINEGYMSWESAFALAETSTMYQGRLNAPHPYELLGPEAALLAALPGSFWLLGDGQTAVIRLKREVSPGTHGAWSESGWSWDESEANFISAVTITADGVEVPIARLIKQSTSRTDNPQAAILDPHVTNDNYDVVDNFVEFSVKLETPIDMDKTILWSIDADIVTEGADGNGEIVAKAIDTNWNIYRDNFIDHITPTARGCFCAKVGTVPKLPDIETGLTPDQTYTEGDTILAADVNASPNSLWVMDIEVTALSGANRVLMEVGDQANGIFVGIIDSVIVIKAGTTATALTISNTLAPANTALPFNRAITLSIHINGTQIDTYVDGVLSTFLTDNSVDPSGWSATVTDGKFGGASGDYMYADIYSPLNANSDVTCTELRFYSNPTLAVALGTKDWYNAGLSLKPTNYYIGKAWESEYTKYIYDGDAFVDMKSPGVINESHPDFAYFILNESLTQFAFNSPNVHGFIAFKAGETWIHGTDYDSIGYSLYSTVLGWMPHRNGSSRDKGFVNFQYGTGGITTFDWSATGLHPYIFTSFGYVEDGVFKVIGKGDINDGHAYHYAANADKTLEDVWAGGIHASTIGGSVTGFIQVDLLPENDGYIRNIIIGEMAYEQVSLEASRGACFSTAGPNELGKMTGIIHKKSYWGNRYNLGGGSNQQAHGIYIKGNMPYTFIEGGWFPEGPGASAKLDTATDLVFEDWVGHSHKSHSGIHNNGTTTGIAWAPTTDRTIRNGRHSNRVVIQDFYGAEADDFMGRMISVVHCEIRRGMLTSLIDQSGLFHGDTGTSNGPGEFGGDSWYSGYHEITEIGTNGHKLQLSWENDRTLEHSYGAHNCYVHKCVLAVHDPITKSAFFMESQSDPSTSTYNEVHAAGGVTSFVISKTHLSGLITDTDRSTISLAAAQTAWTTGGDVLASTVRDGTIVFTVDPYDTDPLLTYYQSIGYNTYLEAETAVLNAWPNWDNVPHGLKTEVVRSKMGERLTTTNLIASDYGGILPGYQSESVQAPDVDPSDNGGRNGWGVVARFFDMPKFVTKRQRNSVVLTKKGWEQRLPGSNAPGAMEVIVAGNFGKVASINQPPVVYSGHVPLNISGTVGIEIDSLIVEVNDPDKSFGGDSVTVQSSSLPAGLSIAKISQDTPLELFRITGTPTSSGAGSFTVTFVDGNSATVTATILYSINGA